MAEFSDYIVYVDESGDLGLRNIDRGFPLFCLAMCVFPIQDYANTTVPAISALKFQHWGHDGVILHENEIRQRKGDFKGIIQNKENELQLIKDVHNIITEANFQIVASVINKAALIKKYSNPWSPYELAVHFCLERLHRLMIGKGQPGKTVHVVFESRGKKEDHELELAFRRIIAGNNSWGWEVSDFGTISYEPKFLPKKTNIAGLQVADLVARPLALKVMRPEQANRTYDVLNTKIHRVKQFP